MIGVMDGTDAVLAPDLMLVESANVLLRKCRRGQLSSEETGRIVDAITDLPARIEPHTPVLSAVFSLASRYGLTVYEVVYLVPRRGGAARSAVSDSPWRSCTERGF